MTHNDSQVEAVMALVEEFGQSKWCEGLADGVFDRRGSRDYADVAAEEFAAIRTALSALAAGKVEAKPTHEQMMAGYAVACRYKVYEAQAFNMAEEMWRAMLAASPSPLSADPESAVVGARQHGFTRDDLECIAEGLEKGYERTVNVGNTTGEGDEHLESTTAAAARFIRAAIAPTLPHPALDRANAGEREREGMQVRQIEDCPELNLSNYGAVDVERLNDWAIRADAEIERLAADPERREGAEGVLVGASVSSPFNKLNGNAYGVKTCGRADCARAGRCLAEVRGDTPDTAESVCPHGVPASQAPSSDRATCPAHGGDYHWTQDCPECVKDARERGMSIDAYYSRVRPTLRPHGVSVPIPHTFAPPDADTDDSMEGGKK